MINLFFVCIGLVFIFALINSFKSPDSDTNKLIPEEKPNGLEKISDIKVLSNRISDLGVEDDYVDQLAILVAHIRKEDFESWFLYTTSLKNHFVKNPYYFYIENYKSNKCDSTNTSVFNGFKSDIGEILNVPVDILSEENNAICINFLVGASLENIISTSNKIFSFDKLTDDEFLFISYFIIRKCKAILQIFPISPDINKIVVIQIISYDEFTDVLGNITYNRSKRLTIDIHILEELGYGFSMDHLSGLARIEFINSYPISQIDHPSELIRPGIIKTSNRKTINKELIKKLKEEAG